MSGPIFDTVVDLFGNMYEGLPKPDTMLTDPKFGMCELETAAKEVMLQFRGRTDWKVSLRLKDFEPEGFCLLCAWGWIKPHYPNGTYCVSRGFVERVTK